MEQKEFRSSLITGDKVIMGTEVKVINDIFTGIEGQSAVLTMGNNIGSMSKGSMEIPLPAKLAKGYFVNGVAGTKPVTDAALKITKLRAEKLAAIVLIPDDVWEDADFDLFAWLQPQLRDAFAEAIDSAAFFENGAPESWVGNGLVSQAIKRGMTVTKTANVYDDILGINGMIDKVNRSGFQVSGWVGDPSVEAILRSAKDENGRPMYQPFLDPITGVTSSTIYGRNYRALLNGAWNDTDNNALMIGGDFSKLVYSIRKEIEFTKSNEASIKGPDGETIDCFQQNVTALRAEMRIAVAVLNPISRLNRDDEKGYPFAVYLNNAPSLKNLTAYSTAGRKAAGDTVVKIAGSIPVDHKLVYKTGENEVTYDQDLSAWTEFPDGGFPDGGLLKGQTDGGILTVAQVDASTKAKAAGIVTVEAK